MILYVREELSEDKQLVGDVTIQEKDKFVRQIKEYGIYRDTDGHIMFYSAEGGVLGENGNFYWEIVVDRNE